nr:MAG TPA: hypothetical protein [Bacteriophage sp.]
MPISRIQAFSISSFVLAVHFNIVSISPSFLASWHTL